MIDWHTYYYVRRNSYVYIHAYPKEYPDRQKAGMVFYVGEGQGNRIDFHLREARKGVLSPKCNVIREIEAQGYEVIREKVRENLTIAEAMSLEERLIREYKPFGHLTNGVGPKYGKHDKPKVSVPIPSVRGDLAKRFRHHASSRAGYKLSEQELVEIAQDLAYSAIDAYCESVERDDAAIIV